MNEEFDDRIEFDHAVISQWSDGERAVIRVDKFNRYNVTTQSKRSGHRLETMPEIYTDKQEALSRFNQIVNQRKYGRVINRLDLWNQKPAKELT